MIMFLFENAYKNVYADLNKKEFPPNSLDPQVFYFTDEGHDPILLPGIAEQIRKDIEDINHTESAFMQTRVWNYVLTGPILNKDSSETCPIVIRLQINTTNLDDVTKERILQKIKEINDKLATGTKHPIVYIPTIRKIEIEKLNGAYDIFRSKWIKKPGFLEESKKTAGYLTRIKNKPRHTLTKGLRKLERA